MSSLKICKVIINLRWGNFGKHYLSKALKVTTLPDAKCGIRRTARQVLRTHA